MQPAIEVRNLVKRYGSLCAVNDVSFTVAVGDVFAFLGPNGAGKTTTINAMVGLAGISAGSITLFGHDVVRDWRAARRLVGVAPQDYMFDRYLTIRDVLIYQAGYYGVPRREITARADELLEQFSLTEKAHQTIAKLSGGMKRRLTLARALIHNPRLLILDEPTAGVDVELRMELWELVRKLNAGGMTILLTTHYLEEAEELCRTVAIINGGRILTIAPTQTLLGNKGRDILRVTFDRDVAQLSPRILAYGATQGPDDPRTLRITGLEPASYPRFFSEIEQSGLRIVDIELRQTNLHDVFLDLVKR
ncbi:MAG TPA: ABC transporter ATP-binding protein [Candidatus Baltobacteraceae bacterium]|nr:ABC transporter ATP-binding protein [Candidatus Baltobacteraceae bacterium]